MNWNELAEAPLEEILQWAETEPWCQAMAACQQDAGWHAEGDVWTHTKLVCAQLLQLEDWPRLPARQQMLLIWTALFHDAAKPLTSALDPETGRIRSPKHAIKGEHLARSVLRDLGCPLVLREEIARLVRFHGRPVFLLDKPEPSHEIVSLSWAVCHRLLYLFALADARGRTTADIGRKVETLHFWKLVAEEQNCFDEPYAFANDQARFLFYRQQPPNLSYQPHEEYRCTVTMMAGLPGSGKDTWLAANRPGLPVVSLDEIRKDLGIGATDNQGAVVQQARELCREHLRARQPFAFNATNILRQTRQRWIDLFADYDARIEIVYLEPPLSRIISQNKRRVGAVPEQVIRELADKLEPPTWSEAHTLILRESATT